MPVRVPFPAGGGVCAVTWLRSTPPARIVTTATPSMGQGRRIRRHTRAVAVRRSATRAIANRPIVPPNTFGEINLDWSLTAMEGAFDMGGRNFRTTREVAWFGGT